MRGVANKGITCTACGSNAGGIDGFCQPCRLKANPPRLKYPFTSEMDEAVRRVYAAGYDRWQKSDAIKDLSRRLNMPPYMVKQRARKLGLTQDVRRFWTPIEIRFLEDYAGEMTVKEIAKHLGRGHETVAAQMERLKISRRVAAGYSQRDLVDVLGVSHQLLAKWEARGWIKRKTERFTDSEIRGFLRKHPEQYDLRRVNQVMFKSLVFDSARTALRGEQA